MADWEGLLRKGLVSAGAYAKHVGGNLLDWAEYPGKVMQQGMRGEDPGLQNMADWSAGTALGMTGGGSNFVPKGAIGSTFSQPLYHGSPVENMQSIKPSTRGPLGPGVYTSPAEQIAGAYQHGGPLYELPQANRDIFRGIGHRTDEEWFGFKQDKQRLVEAAEPEKKQAVSDMLDRMWSNDGYPIYQRLVHLYKGDEGAQSLFKRAGFQGVSGLVDGPEVLLFDEQPLK